MKAIQGLHHITVMAANPQRNIDFYVQVLGQRLVKTTVNFDDPGTYHLYYGDEVGSPGTIMTFFPWANMKRGVFGNGETSAVAYSIPKLSVNYWQHRLEKFKLEFDSSTRFGDALLTFKDPDGLTLELIAHDGAEVPQFWRKGDIPQEHAIRGFHGVSLWEAKREATESILVDNLGFIKLESERDAEGERSRYKAASEGVGLYIDIVERPQKFRGQLGAGSVHHIAFRNENDEEQLEYLSYLRAQGQNVTPVQDRQYFHSIYFREPGGVLFEVATDAPGFAYDEAVNKLGSQLKLPDWLESKRELIEQRLLPNKNPEYEGDKGA